MTGFDAIPVYTAPWYVYMVLAKALQHALVAACRRGVCVRFVTNALTTNDLIFIHTAMVSSMVTPVKAGAQAFLATRVMDHTKFVVVDEQWICIGSCGTLLTSGNQYLVVVDAAIGRQLVRTRRN